MPWPTSSSMRVRRTATSANSAATNNPFIATNNGSATSPISVNHRSPPPASCANNNVTLRILRDSDVRLAFSHIVSIRRWALYERHNCRRRLELTMTARSSRSKIELTRIPSRDKTLNHTDMKNTSIVLTLALSAFAFASISDAQEKKPTAAAIQFFESKVRPVLVENCFECHSG